MSSTRLCARAFALGSSLYLALLGLSPGVAYALGFELQPAGARNTGRAGASVVGADTAMGMHLNAATILAPSTLADGEVSLQLGFTEVCYTAQAVNEDTAGNRSGGAESPRQCSDAKAGYVPALGTALRLGKRQRVALALGFYAPPAVGRDVQATPSRARSTATPARRSRPRATCSCRRRSPSRFPRSPWPGSRCASCVWVRASAGASPPSTSQPAATRV